MVFVVAVHVFDGCIAESNRRARSEVLGRNANIKERVVRMQVD